MPLHPLEPIPAVRRIDTDREDLFAAEIAGEVTGSDFENLCGLLEGAYALHDKIDLLLRFVDHEGVEWDDVASSTIEEARGHAGRHVRRCAVIGASSVARPFSDILGPSGVETRRFDPGEADQAWQWLGATEIPEQT